MLSDASDQVRLVAVQALSTSRDPHAVTALVIALTKDVEPTIRREAALALGKLLDEKTVDDLRKLGLQALATAAERDPDLDVCVAARSALRSLARFSQKQTRPRAPAR
jgi:HEAT repeat protein